MTLKFNAMTAALEEAQRDVSKLNEWKDEQLRDWKLQPTWTASPQLFFRRRGFPAVVASALSLGHGSVRNAPSKAELQSSRTDGCREV